jgi:hypothetical protein
MVALDSVSMMPLLLGRTQQVRDPDRGYLLAENINPLQNELHQAAGARDGRYKLICNNRAEVQDCTFYDLSRDPLEEYPLPKPESCAGEGDVHKVRAAPQWHFCRLLHVIATESFLAPPAAAQ